MAHPPADERDDERDDEALRLRDDLRTFDHIAASLGLTDRVAAFAAVHRRACRPGRGAARHPDLEAVMTAAVAVELARCWAPVPGFDVMQLT